MAGKRTAARRKKTRSLKKGGFKKTSNFSKGDSTKGWSKKARLARRNARLNAKRGTDRVGSLKIKWSARDALRRLSNKKLAKTLGLSGIGNWTANKIPKSWKVNVNIPSAIKSKPGEKNYRSSTSKTDQFGSGGHIYLTDQQLDDYDFYNKYNPQARTITEMKNLYRRQLKEGMSLKEAMQYNPSETMYYDALIDDPENQIRGLYQSVLGRKADDAGLDYWKKEYESGKSNIQSIKDSFLKSDEYLKKNPSTGSSTTANLDSIAKTVAASYTPKTKGKTGTTNNKKDLASVVAAINRGTYNT